MGLTLDILLRRQGAPAAGADLDGSAATKAMEASLKRQADLQRVLIRGAKEYGDVTRGAFGRVETLLDAMSGSLKETNRLLGLGLGHQRDFALQAMRTADATNRGFAAVEAQQRENNALTQAGIRAQRELGTAGLAAADKVLTGLDKIEAAQKRTAAAARLTARAVGAVGEAAQSEAIQANLALRRITANTAAPRAAAGGVGATPVQLSGGLAGGGGFLRGGSSVVTRTFGAGRAFAGDLVNLGSRFGGEAQGAFRDAFSGPLLGGGVVRGAGGLAAAGIRGATGAAASVAGLLGPVGGVLGGALGVGGALGGAVVGAAGELAGAFVDKFVGVAKVGLVAGLGVAVAAGVSVTKSALAIDELEPQFAKFARTTGDSVPSALAKLQGSVDGTISKLDLMGLANQASLLGFEGGVDTLAQYYDLVKSVGDAAGTDATKAIEAFTQAVGTGSERGLKTALRVTVDFKQATADAATQLRRDADTFTEQELISIRLAAATNALRQRLGETGQAAEGLDDKADRLKATLSDTSYEAGKNLKPALAAAFDALQPLASGFAAFVGANTASQADLLTGKVRGIRDVLKEAGEFVGKLTLEDVFALGSSYAEEFGVRAKAVFRDVAEYGKRQLGAVYAEMQAFLADNPWVMGAIAGAAGGSVAGPLGTLVGAGAGALGGALGGLTGVGDEAARQKRDIADSLRGAAGNLTFAPEVDDLARIRAERAATLAAINGRPSRLPPASGPAATSQPTPVVVVNPGLVGPASRPAAPASRPAVPPVGIDLPEMLEAQRHGYFYPGDLVPTPVSGTGGAGQSGPRDYDAAAAAAGRATLTAALPGSLSPEVIAQLSGFVTAAASEQKRFNAAVKALADAQQDAADNAAEAEILAPLVRRANDAKSELARLEEREARARQRAVEDVSAAWVDLWTYERDAADEIRQNFDAGFAALQDGLSQSLDGITAAVQSRAQGLLGQVGGLEPSEDDGIPTKFKSAARKVRKRAARERRRSLQQLAGGRGSDDLAADGGALLTQLFEEQSAREIGAADARQAAMQAAFDGLNRLFEERTVAEIELKAAVEAQTEAIVSHAETSADTLDAVVELAKTQTDALKAAEAKLEELTRVVNALRRGTK